MKDWEIIFYKTGSGRKPVQEFIDGLSDKDQAKIAWGIGLLEQYGVFLKRPYLAHLYDKLWELRAGRYRIFLSCFSRKRILLLHVILKKTQKVPKKDLKLVEQRLKQFM